MDRRMFIQSQKIQIRGTEQWIYLTAAGEKSGDSETGFLFLHGGPGWADSPWAHQYCHSIWGRFTTVHWDQRGANRSDDCIKMEASAFTIAELVEDTLEIARILRRDFGIRKLILVGHSWGAFLGVLAAVKAPELFRAYIGIGQLVANSVSEPLSLTLAIKRAEHRGSKEVFQELKGMSEDFYFSVPALFRQRELLFKIGGEFHLGVSEDDMIKWTEQAPEAYRSSLKRLYLGCEKTMNLMWPELIRRNLFDEVKTFPIPICLIYGRHDLVTPASVAENWLSQLHAPQGKEGLWFENSAHWPQIEENQRFVEFLQRYAAKHFC